MAGLLLLTVSEKVTETLALGVQIHFTSDLLLLLRASFTSSGYKSKVRSNILEGFADSRSTYKQFTFELVS